MRNVFKVDLETVDAIKKGDKRVDIRCDFIEDLMDYSEIKVGDLIEYDSVKLGNKVYCHVTQINRYESVKDSLVNEGVRYTILNGIVNNEFLNIKADVYAFHISPVVNATSISAPINSRNNLVPKDRLVFRGYEIYNLDEIFKKLNYKYEKLMYLVTTGKIADEKELFIFIKNYRNARSLVDDREVSSCLEYDCNTFIQKTVLGFSGSDYFVTCNTLEDLQNNLFLLSHVLFDCIRIYCNKKYNYKMKQMDRNYSLAEKLLCLTNNNNRTDYIDCMDLLMALYIDHGGGNNSTYTMRVMASSGTNFCACISAAMGSLSGNKHGGALPLTGIMMDDIMKHCDYKSLDELKKYLEKIIDKDAFLKDGKIYGIGHAVYKNNDPRTELLKPAAHKLAISKNCQDLFDLYHNVEVLSKEILKEKKQILNIITNCDYYANLILRLFQIPDDIMVSIFGLSRVIGWGTHYKEQLDSGNRLIRPEYIYLEK